METIRIIGLSSFQSKKGSDLYLVFWEGPQQSGGSGFHLGNGSFTSFVNQEDFEKMKSCVGHSYEAMTMHFGQNHRFQIVREIK